MKRLNLGHCANCDRPYDVTLTLAITCGCPVCPRRDTARLGALFVIGAILAVAVIWRVTR